jgi:carbamoyl-phosphate synthase small subunit
MMGVITEAEPQSALARLQDLPAYEGSEFVKEVSARLPTEWNSIDAPAPRIVVLDLGVKQNILRILGALGCRITVVPHSTPGDEILSLSPDGVVMSPGPGDPALLDYVTGTAQKLLGRVPIFGICLGHQVLARMWGANTFKLKFGHRGANHPVREVASGRVSITAQNHGYAVDPDRLPSHVDVSHVNLNDGTCEGLRDREQPVFSIQYHSEASPGPHDDRHLFESFLRQVVAGKIQ